MNADRLIIVTASDSKFAFGVFLLVASLRRCGVTHRVHYLAENVSEKDCSIIEQFPDVSVRRVAQLQSRAYQKPEAILSASRSGADFVCWIDADCFVRGKVEHLFFPSSKNDFMIRYRSPEENKLRFPALLDRDRQGHTPVQVLDRWKRDVNEREDFREVTTCVTNCFTIHCEFLPLIEKWYGFMQGLLGDSHELARDLRFAYTHSSGSGLSDELALNAVLNYSSCSVPDTHDYRLDKNIDTCLVHFGLNPKPWVRWSLAHYKYYPEVMTIIDWVRTSGFELPSLPLSMRKNFGIFVYLQILANPLIRLHQYVSVQRPWNKLG